MYKIAGKIFIGLVAVTGVVLALSEISAANQRSATDCDIAQSSFCLAPRLSTSTNPLKSATIPKIATPVWLGAPAPEVRVVGYQVATRGAITSDFAQFQTVAAATLNDPRGWSRLGVRFEQVTAGGSFTLYLSEAAQLPSFSASGCDAMYSCRVGDDVIINQDRWQGATPSWSNGGGDLAGYRQMVINHETGHWLGHGHTFCSGPNQPATVMQQQSMDLQGCSPNSWPLQSEMYAPNLGIRS